MSGHSEWRPSFNPWLVAVSVMAATFMEVLDTSVANVALPHIAGNLSVTTDEATWVLTSYLVSNAIILPATAWLSSLFGRKRFLVGCISVFTLASVLSGAATSLNMLVLARILQGVGGGALQPIAQSVLLESFPPHKRGQAMAFYGMGIVVAPVIGPTLGGWITDNYSWRWIFYINLPIGIIATLMAQAFVEDPPYLKRGVQKIDYIGFGLMAIWLATLQIILDKGQQDDWFQAPWIRWFAVISVLAMIAFLVWELMVDHPIVQLRVLKNRNFAVATMMITVLGVVLFGSTALLPLFLQNLMGYPALNSGLAVSPRGIGAFLSMMIVGRIIGKVDTRFLIGGGFIGLSSTMFMLSHINLDITAWNIMLPNILSGVTMGFIFVPLTTSSTATLPQAEIGNASGIYNLMRNIGGSIGISVVTTLLARAQQVHQAVLATHMTPFDPAFTQAMSGIQGALSSVSDPVTAGQQAYAVMYGRLLQQASLVAFVDVFHFMGVLTMCAFPLVFVMKRIKAVRGPISAH
jgi:DHA2 family multidrug resistance protein